VEKAVEAHTGALISLRWNHDGTAVATSGEDGGVKVWSRNGMLRTTLASGDRPVYCLAWSPDNESVAYGSGKDVVVKPLKPAAKRLQWHAHDGVVLCIDWNPVHGMLVTGAEDCRYKVFDGYGRVVFASRVYDHPLTSAKWAPDGDVFAVGSFDMLRVCDKTGWSYTMERPSCGSVLALSWTADGTLLAGAGGNGSVLFGSLVNRVLQHGGFEVALKDPFRVTVEDLRNNSLVEELEFRDRVVKLAFGFDHLVVATSTQCCLYTTHNFTAPVIFDLKDTVTLIVQAPKFFVLVDNGQGIQVFTYEGRMVSQPKSAGASEFLSRASISLCNDALALVDRADAKQVRVFDVASGKQMGNPIVHTMDVLEVALDQHGPATARKLAIVDRNRDLYITPVHKPALVKLAAMVGTCMWNESNGMLAAHTDDKVVVWTYPNVVYVDRDLTDKTTVTISNADLRKDPQLVSFAGTSCTFRRSDGALVAVGVPPYPGVLYEHCDRGEWDDAVRLCRHVREVSLFACLAAMAINANVLDTAEVAYAACNEVDKLQFILHIKDIKVPEARMAELLLFRRRYDEAEATLVQAGLIYRAIKANIKLYKWDRALELAQTHAQGKQWVDLVLAHRERYLADFKLEETNDRFKAAAAKTPGPYNWAQIKERVAAEKEREKSKIK
jgi:intraflagellar transport protein 80